MNDRERSPYERIVELERENAALREKLQIEEERSMYWRKAARKEAQS